MRVAVIGLLIYVTANPQSTAEKEILQFERDACKILDANVLALERVLTPDFTLAFKMVT